MRWLHISSVAALVGGMLFGCVALVPATCTLALDARKEVIRRATVLFRPVVYAAIPALLLSGVYNILSTFGHSTRYHILLGVKLLLVLHIFVTGVLVTTGRSSAPGRAMAGAAIAGFIVIAISAYLRRFF